MLLESCVRDGVSAEGGTARASSEEVRRDEIVLCDKAILCYYGHPFFSSKTKHNPKKVPFFAF
jgi:hypothetical protein